MVVTSTGPARERSLRGCTSGPITSPEPSRVQCARRCPPSGTALGAGPSAARSEGPSSRLPRRSLGRRHDRTRISTDALASDLSPGRGSVEIRSGAESSLSPSKFEGRRTRARASRTRADSLPERRHRPSRSVAAPRRASGPPARPDPAQTQVVQDLQGVGFGSLVRGQARPARTLKSRLAWQRWSSPDWGTRARAARPATHRPRGRRRGANSSMTTRRLNIPASTSSAAALCRRRRAGSSA